MFTVRIWDLPTRLFHWALAFCVVGLLITGNVGGNAMSWHFRLGYAVLTLVLFRISWGVVGGRWSRWSQLPISPYSVWAYICGRSTVAHSAGHTPLGSWSVLSLLLLLFIQATTGLICDDEIANLGPLSSLAPGHWVNWATAWHKGWGKTLLILQVMVHLLAIAWYRWQKKQALVPAMWHGNKALPQAIAASRDDAKSRFLALALFILSAFAVSFIVWLGG